MISGLNGVMVRLQASAVYVDTAGVEYEVHIPLSVFEKLQLLSPGETIHLHIHHQFLQEEQKLYGFLDLRQRRLFSALQTIKGLGTSLALSILSHMDGPGLLDLCEKGDLKTLCRIPRVGKSTAETIVFEINRKRDKWKKLLLSNEESELLAASVGGEEEMAFQALVQLGYKEPQIRSLLVQLKKEGESSGAPFPGSRGAAEIIRDVLKFL